jgi:hypothetical protein
LTPRNGAAHKVNGPFKNIAEAVETWQTGAHAVFTRCKCALETLGPSMFLTTHRHRR